MTQIRNPQAPAPKPKKQSVFGLLFNPHLGDSIRPAGEALGMFVTMVAMIFAMNGLFPKDHPGLKGGGRLRLEEVLRTAWGDLSFTRDGMPKVLLFFAVSGGIVLSILSIITALAMGLMGHAHAQTVGPSIFTPPDATGDLASNWINFLFNPTESAAAGANIASTLSSTTGGTVTMPSSTIQSALGTALGVYSGAILIIAAFILFYHLAAMVAETAHHGKPFGNRASQIWAPIRLVVAVGLLVPVSSSGLNCGQYIVLALTQAGSGLASNVWSGFVKTLTADSTAPAPDAAVDVSSAVYDLTMMYACEYAYNFQIYASQIGTIKIPDENINGWGWTLNGPPSAPPSASTAPGKYSFTNNLESGYDMCGSYIIPSPPQMSDPTVQEIATSTYNTIIQDFVTASAAAAKEAVKIQAFMGADFANYTAATGTAISYSSTLPTPDDIINMANTYAKNVEAALGAPDVSSAVDALGTNSTKEGWISAGAWFNSLSSLVAETNEIISESLPTTTPPDFSNHGGPVADKIRANEGHGWFWRPFLGKSTAKGSEGAYIAASNNLAAFSGAIESGAPASSSSGSSSSTTSNATSSASDNCGPSDPVGCILWLAERGAEQAGVWHDGTSGTNNLAIGVQFSGADPLMQMAQFGHNSIGAAISYFDWGIWMMGGSSLLSFASFLPGVGVVAKIGTAVATALFFIGVLFFTMGIIVAFIIPLLPFMHFFFNSITWMTCVAEAIIGVPLMALAHLNPEGEGIAGQAKNAYQMIFSVLLRPVMMVFGLIVGLLIMYVAAGLLNALYAYAVAGAGTGNLKGAHAAISRIMFTVFYVAMLYSIANHAFRMIARLPNQAMQWMAGVGLSGETMGEPSHINAWVGAAGAYFGDRSVNQLRNVGDAIGNAGNSAAGAIKGSLAKDAAIQGRNSVDAQGNITGSQRGIGRFVPEAREAFQKGQTSLSSERQSGIASAVRDLAHNNNMSVDDLLANLNPNAQVGGAQNSQLADQLKDITGNMSATDIREMYRRIFGA
ncbi:MAG: DotA/TraY family protein [Alphaproteobacteria bacterium]|nr:DotA/TraY family protein [Alphaproteobacteria bacterium]